MFCSNCGNKLGQSDNFCGMCGKKIIDNIQVNTSQIYNTSENVSKNSSTQKGKPIMKQYKLNAFNDQCIKQFLAMNGLEYNNYLFGTIMPKFSTYALIGMLANFGMLRCIISFDTENIYIFQLSRLSNKSIENCTIINKNEIFGVDYKEILLGVSYKINIKFSNGKILNIQANKKINEFPTQLDGLNKLFNLKNNNL